MKITAQTTAYVRHDCVGDWLGPADDLDILVKDLGDDGMTLALMIHEAVEALHCARNGVTEESVDEWDKNYGPDGEPGDDPDCPYRLAHQAAETVERAVCEALGIAWTDYESALEKALG